MPPTTFGQLDQRAEHQLRGDVQRDRAVRRHRHPGLGEQPVCLYARRQPRAPSSRRTFTTRLTTNYFPSVFRPLFTTNLSGGYVNIFITGYARVPSVAGPADPQLAPPMDLSYLAAISSPPVVNLATNVYGVPWIIGVKKGFPTFNEYVQENIVGLTRRLQVTRDVNYEMSNPFRVRLIRTNQMLLFSVNTSAGVDFWNSYNSSFTDNVMVVCHGLTYMTITNDDPGFDGTTSGVQQPMAFQFNTFNTRGPAAVAPNPAYWPGTAPWNLPQPLNNGQPNPGSFYVPVYFADYEVLTNSVYRTPSAFLTPGALPPGFKGPCLIPTNYFGVVGMTVLFETNTPGVPQPYFHLPNFGMLSTNFLQTFILDGANGVTNVIDYVQLEQGNSQSLNAELFTDDLNGVWNPIIDYNTGGNNVSYGIENQLYISGGWGFGEPPREDGVWQADPEAANTANIPQQQANFRAFFQPWGTQSHLSDGYGQATGSNFEAQVAAPYAPTRYAVNYTVLQANDPLVHFLASDMVPSWPSGLKDFVANYDNTLTNVPPLTDNGVNGPGLGSLNANYQPWGGNPTWTNVPDANANNLAERDPMVSQPDFWAFPANKFPTVGWLGRVHRGTPWQSVYLKSVDILSQNYGTGTNTWVNWTGNPNSYDATNAAPTQDWLLFDFFSTAPNDNATRGTLSVNQSAANYDPDGIPADANPAAGLAAWSAVFSGMVVPNPTNAANYTVINPVGPNPAGSPLWQIVTNINGTRANFKNTEGLVGVFEHQGDILATPALSNPSLFYPTVNPGQFSDQMYEWLPQQALSLLRDSTSPRYVIYTYGQALKPAPGGVYLNPGPFFGLVTNYQVTAETTARAVIRFDTMRTNANGVITVTPPRAVIENFNLLPPD